MSLVREQLPNATNDKETRAAPLASRSQEFAPTGSSKRLITTGLIQVITDLYNVLALFILKCDV